MIKCIDISSYRITNYKICLYRRMLNRPSFNITVVQLSNCSSVVTSLYKYIILLLLWWCTFLSSYSYKINFWPKQIILFIAQVRLRSDSCISTQPLATYSSGRRTIVLDYIYTQKRGSNRRNQPTSNHPRAPGQHHRSSLRQVWGRWSTLGCGVPRANVIIPFAS